jgi:hypothetical protein
MVLAVCVMLTAIFAPKKACAYTETFEKNMKEFTTHYNKAFDYQYLLDQGNKL